MTTQEPPYLFMFDIVYKVWQVILVHGLYFLPSISVIFFKKKRRNI